MIVLARELRKGDCLQVPREGDAVGEGPWLRVKRAARRGEHVLLRLNDGRSIACPREQGWRVRRG